MNSLHFNNAKPRFFWCSGFRHLVLVICALLSSPVPVLAQGVYDRHVVILAIDGLQADIFERYAFKGEGNPPSNSILRQLSRPKGELKEHLNIKLTSAVFPTYTFAAWASIFTGKYPGRAGIQGQNFYVRDSDTTRAYDVSAGVSDILLCDFPDAFEIFGWEFDCAALWGYLLSAGLNSEPFNLVGVAKLIEKLPEPSV